MKIQRTWKHLGGIWGILLVLAGGLSAMSYEEIHSSWGDEPNGHYGQTGALVGDLNGDGYDDLAVGAHKHFSRKGAVYVFFGGPSPSTMPDLVLVGEDNGDAFGNAVAGAGDVNGDGYDDLVVGAYGYGTIGLAGRGAAYIFYGGASMDSLYDVKMVGDTAYDWFGWSVAGAGDVNDDGYDDVIVGAAGVDVSGKADAGAAYIFFGGSAMDSLPDLTLYGENTDDYFGRSVAGLGDLDGDGYDDVIVGAPWHDVGSATSAGAAYVFLGGSPMDVGVDYKLEGEGAGDKFGYAVAGAGDMNGDGAPDILVGAPHRTVSGFSTSGVVYLYWGGIWMDLGADVKFSGAKWSVFGISVSGAGDVNGDGYDDIIVGAPEWQENGQRNAGAAYLFLGGSTVDSLPDAVIEGTQVFGGLGTFVSGGGDFNGNGFPDVAVGADSSGPNHEGEAWVYQFQRFRLLSPTGGEPWTVGSRKTIRWMGRDTADLYLSVDGGATWTPLAQNLHAPSPIDTLEFTLQVPHWPTRYALVRVTLHGESTPDPLYFAQSDTFFTINATITLLTFEAEIGEEGKVSLSWQTDPGPEDLVGYHIYRLNADGTETRLTATPIRGQAYEDEATPGVKGYALGAVNGLGTEYRIGEVTLSTLQNPVQVLPTLVRQEGALFFAVPAFFTATVEQPVRVDLFNAAGQKVLEVFRGTLQPGVHRLSFSTQNLSSGVYFAVVQVGSSYRRSTRFQVLHR